MELLHQLTCRLGRRGLILIAGAALALATTTAVFADSTTVTMNVNGGSLAESVSATPVSTPVTLNGTDQTTSYTFSVDANDPTGSGNGWKLQITSTTFGATISGTPHSLPVTASSVTSASASCKQGTCTSPTTSSLSYPVAVPAAATPPAAVTFFNAATNTGLGEFIVSPSVQVNIPANTYAGSYASTLTLSVVSGP